MKLWGIAAFIMIVAAMREPLITLEEIKQILIEDYGSDEHSECYF
jgi:hypothetical protein